MSKKDYDIKYQKENLTQINIRVKPEIKKQIEEASVKCGKSTRAFILDAIFDALKKGEA